jgi:aspartyl-tRNA(Asn)/glutamyl-tRNA(Gln) amidotransferase subunit A
LLEHYLERIDRYEPAIRAWVLVDPARARSEAEARDAELKKGYDRGPLHGIPVGIKDIFDVFDWPTACGSELWKSAVARQDATVVRRLRDAGCVLIGKTVTTQYASFDPPPTRNPWHPSRTPGGSSSGSAAAVAARMCLAALGSQTGGSITRPASYCGVPSCKPTYGAVSLDGILPLAPSMDHPGPMASCVSDVELVSKTIADPGAWSRAAVSPRLRIGRLRALFERRADDEVRAMVDGCCRRIEEGGGVVTDVALPAGFEDVIARHAVLMAVEAAAYHRDRLGRHPEDYRPRIRSLIEEGIRCPAPDYYQAKEHQARLKAEMAGVFAEVDVLIAPATTCPAPDAATTGDPSFNSPWSFTGLPVVSLPVALSRDGLPLGVQLVGNARGEPGLFAVAAWVEQVVSCAIGDPPLAG